jgi:hypothetical protein
MSFSRAAELRPLALDYQPGQHMEAMALADAAVLVQVLVLARSVKVAGLRILIVECRARLLAG